MHRFGDGGEFALVAVGGIDLGPPLGAEVMHQGVTHLAVGGRCRRCQPQVVLDGGAHGRHDLRCQREAESEYGGEVVILVVLDADGGGAIGVELCLCALEGEIHQAFALHLAVGGAEAEVGFDDSFRVGHLGFGANHVFVAATEVCQHAVGREQFVVGRPFVGEECRTGFEGGLVDEDGGTDALALPVGGYLGHLDMDGVGVGVVGIGQQTHLLLWHAVVQESHAAVEVEQLAVALEAHLAGEAEGGTEGEL